jgi:hypothetical protein
MCVYNSVTALTIDTLSDDRKRAFNKDSARDSCTHIQQNIDRKMTASRLTVLFLLIF